MEIKKRMVCDIPEALHIEIKKICAQQKISLSRWFIRAIVQSIYNIKKLEYGPIKQRDLDE